MKQKIHYSAQGASLAFPCYYRDLNAHLESAYVLPAEVKPNHYSSPKTLHRIPPPRSHTNLKRITCQECWLSISMMANKALR